MTGTKTKKREEEKGGKGQYIYPTGVGRVVAN